MASHLGTATTHRMPPERLNPYLLRSSVDTPADGCRRHGCLPGRRRGDFGHRAACRVAHLAAGGLHRVIRVLTGCRHLGLSQRDLPHSCARERSEPGQLHPLVHERANLRCVPGDGCELGAAPFTFFAGMMVAQFLVVLMFFPETKGITLEEMERRLESQEPL